MRKSFGRRQFLRASTGALAVGVVACSDDGSGGSAGTTLDTIPASSGSEPTAAPGTTTAAGTTTTVAQATAATVLAAPGSPGLIDEAVYQQRSTAYLQFATQTPKVGSPVGVAAHLARAAREPDFEWEYRCHGVLAD